MGFEGAARYPAPTTEVSWGPLVAEDTSQLAGSWWELEAAAAAFDGAAPPGPVEVFAARLEKAHNWDINSIGGYTVHGTLVARGWIATGRDLKNEYRIFLDGLVHPEFRGLGLGSTLLDWLTARGTRVLDELPDDRGKTLRHDFYARPPEAIALLESHGYRFHFAEDELRRSLANPIPQVSLAPGLTFHAWTPDLAQEFYQVYRAAFQARPGFPGWTEEVWVSAFTGDEDFRPDLSLLLKNENSPVSYALVDVAAGSNEGWVSQMGVAPRWRRRGFGVAILVEVIRRLSSEGLQSIGLDVNVNNPEAANLYKKLGFKPFQRYTSYRRILRPISVE